MEKCHVIVEHYQQSNKKKCYYGYFTNGSPNNITSHRYKLNVDFYHFALRKAIWMVKSNSLL